jgi:glycosyltransferase involved in cell wall biosynthesis
MPDQLVSIIIPFQGPGDYLRETLQHISDLEYQPLEIILLPDAFFDLDFFPANIRARLTLQVISTGEVSPAIKRDVGAEKSQGEILAFIDDDAYPDSYWLDKALPHFSNPDIAAVGGPQITPESDSFRQKVSGAVFLSPLNGKAVCRYWPCAGSFEVDDWPSVNLLVRKQDFLQIGGFDSQYWPGEDTKLCLDIADKLGKKIIYEPQAKVYHHRRTGIGKHIKQIGNYGLHRGYFAKSLPRTSCRLAYFVPSLFFLFVLLGWVGLFIGFRVGIIYLLLWCVYLLSLIVSTLGIFQKVRDLKIALATVPYIVGTHFWYGWRFMQGLLFTRDLKSKLGR